jgi:hypothetical protein
MEKYFTVACFIAISIILLSITIGYLFAESRTRENYTQIQAETLSREFIDSPVESMNMIGKKFAIEGKVKDVLCIKGKYTTLIDCGEYPQIYVENCAKKEGDWCKINIKIKEFIGFIVAIEII